MTTFTIETATNNLTAHGTQEDAQAVPNSEHFSSAEELAKLSTDWPSARLIEIWNSIPGVAPVRKFTDRKAATTRIWKAIQSLAESIPAETTTETEPLTSEAQESGTSTAPEPELIQDQSESNGADQEQAAPVSDKVEPEPAADQVDPNVSGQAPDVAPGEPKATKKATRGPKTPTCETGTKAPREASKSSQVIAMLKREGGTTLEELMAAMGWQKHTTRAMLSAGGSLTKKHGITVVSEKVDGKRFYSIKS